MSNENTEFNTWWESVGGEVLGKNTAFAGWQASVAHSAARIAEPVAWLVNYYEETKGGGKRNVTQASLEPTEPSIMLQFEPDIAERKLIKAEPLYALPPNIPAMIEQARAEEREACAKVCESEWVGDSLNDESGSNADMAYNEGRRDCAAAIRARGEKK